MAIILVIQTNLGHIIRPSVFAAYLMDLESKVNSTTSFFSASSVVSHFSYWEWLAGGIIVPWTCVVWSWGAFGRTSYYFSVFDSQSHHDHGGINDNVEI